MAIVATRCSTAGRYGNDQWRGRQLAGLGEIGLHLGFIVPTQVQRRNAQGYPGALAWTSCEGDLHERRAFLVREVVCSTLEDAISRLEQADYLVINTRAKELNLSGQAERFDRGRCAHRASLRGRPHKAYLRVLLEHGFCGRPGSSFSVGWALIQYTNARQKLYTGEETGAPLATGRVVTAGDKAERGLATVLPNDRLERSVAVGATQFALISRDENRADLWITHRHFEADDGDPCCLCLAQRWQGTCRHWRHNDRFRPSSDQTINNVGFLVNLALGTGQLEADSGFRRTLLQAGSEQGRCHFGRRDDNANQTCRAAGPRGTSGQCQGQRDDQQT